MPAHRLTMRTTREILRLRLGLALPIRHVARSCHVSPSTVHDCLARAVAAGLTWPLPADLDDGALEARLYPGKPGPRETRAAPAYAAIYRELKRKGVTLELLWQEYKQQHPDDGYQYSQFCERYRQWRAQLDVVMRHEHRAGEKLFVDYAGEPMPIVDPATGEVRPLPVFVATLGASNYTFAEVHDDQTLGSWIRGHIHAFEFFHGVPAVLVPDNLKVGVKHACFYEPDLNPTYQELATHYGAVILPARPRKPRDKAKVENAVQQVERLLARLRHQQFFSRGEGNTALQQQVTALNRRPFAKLAGSRRSLFEELDRPALRPLPATRYEPAEWKPRVGVNIDYHIEFARHYYSVPYQLVGKRVEVRATMTTVECFHRHRRVASHRRSDRPGGFTTDPSHRPKAHRRYAEWTPSRLIRWAETVGPQTATVIATILERKPHPEQGFRTGLGILRLAKRFTRTRLEHACARALTIDALSYRSIRSMLTAGLDREALPVPPTLAPIAHANIRGSTYYDEGGSDAHRGNPDEVE